MKRLLFLASTLTISFSLSMALVKEARAYSFTSLDVPGATAAIAYGINDAGSVVGSYYDATGWYGFIATAQPGDPTYNASVPEPSTLLLLGSGFAGLAVFRKRFKE